jgi:dipeptidase E
MKTKKLFLTSNGITPPLTEPFLKFLEKSPAEMTVAFIPTAADPDPSPNPHYVAQAKKELIDLGFKVTDIDLKKYNEDSLKEELQKADIIYVGGGNTFYLLHWAKQSGLNNIIHDLINQGKIYIGNSAGSVLAGPNIELAGWIIHQDDNDLNLEDLTGFNMVPFAISPHYNNHHQIHISKLSENLTYDVIPLTNFQAIQVTDNTHDIVGETNVN